MESNPSSQRKKIMAYVIGSFLLTGAIVFSYWLFWARFEVTTEDAYVHGNKINLTPQISGFVSAVHVNETQSVKEGQLLISLDTSDMQIALEKSFSQLAETVRNVSQFFEKVEVLKAQLEMRKANLTKATIEYDDRKSLVLSGSVSKEDFIDSETRYLFAKADVDNIESQLKQAYAAVAGTCVSTHPLVESAKEHARQAWLDFKRCNIVSPTHGIIAQRSAQVGEAVNPNDPLLAIIPIDQIWVNANFKETQLKQLRIGQNVELTADMYGHFVKYRGTVVGIGAGSGSVFSLLPPQNATGNWIKIVQRIPVRIRLDPQQVAEYPLFLGLSMQVKVDIQNTSGTRIPAPQSTETPLYTTQVFRKQEEGIEPILVEIIQKNQILFSRDWCKNDV
ncbi:MAG: hypothetical protein ACD_17C00104G0002 [uncultured bacterium]|nr:MAG: hypothetical protein ACD_17C00104G0002 [uncultured bacterium]OGN55497.1 MAG: hypothetical protein A2796_05280 [Chlamydiae bacterium RIFCSPHIGHO2_01_FULL_44_39]OGN57062.1 MAG: hypothetical protein A3C42_05935 [Chlamydiae bacterium RIFCSPHIGHO2_02_FULL_45_9]OGN59997.1 MAG: hypothetical protein A3D96_02555 [Chlamydiae bacterium RIFCSPHIGHO2_12_FULL_44_59]OGN65924.1 MAG: hypothetical protein A2978_06370 [Chlamydiae bacterium RIFCSPLOWO2_01_FULL_44_52]OGN68184.1 MAG: hypothetical protein A3